MTTRGESFASIRQIIERRAAAKEKLMTFEVKIQVTTERGTWPVTVATFEDRPVSSRRYLPQPASVRAVAFAKLFDKALAVSVVNVEDEDNRAKAFGLTYHRDADLS